MNEVYKYMLEKWSVREQTPWGMSISIGCSMIGLIWALYNGKEVLLYTAFGGIYGNSFYMIGAKFIKLRKLRQNTWDLFILIKELPQTEEVKELLHRLIDKVKLWDKKLISNKKFKMELDELTEQYAACCKAIHAN